MWDADILPSNEEVCCRIEKLGLPCFGIRRDPVGHACFPSETLIHSAWRVRLIETQTGRRTAP